MYYTNIQQWDDTAAVFHRAIRVSRLTIIQGHFGPDSRFRAYVFPVQAEPHTAIRLAPRLAAYMKSPAHMTVRRTSLVAFVL
jgi:hypothetical protein